MKIREMGGRAVRAARKYVRVTSVSRNSILSAMADELEKRKKDILGANAKDVAEAKKDDIPSAIIDRLTINDARFSAMVFGARATGRLKDPVGEILSRNKRPNGLEIVKKRVPIGVLAIIFESRPNVTADAMALCVKTSNAVILRGGKEALRSNSAIADAMIAGGMKKGLPEDAVQLVRSTSHDDVKELVGLEGIVDLVIPRGGERLIRAVVDNARVPVIKHYKGVCHVYVDESADLKMALKIIENAKCQRPGVCNAMECMLVHKTVARRFIPAVVDKLSIVKFRGDKLSVAIDRRIAKAVEKDFYTEYLDYEMNVKVVGSVDEAIGHINKYGSRHSDSIITRNKAASRRFQDEVDSAVVYVNASTRFTDGGEFGMGAEMGISTDKLHCRGPMGLEELTTYKYFVSGSGQIR